MDGDAISTERLLLRRWRADDDQPLVDVFAKPDVWWFPFQRGWSADETHRFLARKLEQWESRGWSQWAVVHKADQRLIGFLGLEPPDFLPEVMPTVEVGWRLDPDYWGQGLATEGGHAALRFAFDALVLDEVVSIYQPANVASGRVMERLGMWRDRDTVHPELKVALRVYRLSRERWLAQPSGP